MRRKAVSTYVIGCLALLVAISTEPSRASTISASYTVTGTSGNFDLNFTVANHLDAWPTLDAYYFGVELSQSNITGLPAGYQDFSFIGPYSNQLYGGSSTIYNNLWIDFSFSGLFPGQSLSGFTAHITDATAPVSVNFFAWAFDPITQVAYTGPGNFNEGDINDPDGINPGFEGVALVASSVPEPSTLCLTGMGGVLALLLHGFQRRRATAARSLVSER